MTYTSRTLALLTALSLSACGGQTFSNPFKPVQPEDTAPSVVLPEDASVVVPEAVPEVVQGAGGRTPDALDQTSAVELAAAADVSGGNALGDTVASLGDPTQPGLWLRTPLVKSEMPGRVSVEGGKSLAVTLIPIEGEASAGSQMSLGAMRGLGLGLTDLPTVQVFRITAAG